MCQPRFINVCDMRLWNLKKAEIQLNCEGRVYEQFFRGGGLWIGVGGRVVELFNILCLYIITLHYVISNANYTYSGPMVHQQSHSSSPNASLKRWVFKSFLKVSVFVSSWRSDGREFHAFGPENEKLRSPNFSFNRGSSYRRLRELCMDRRQ